LKTFFITTLLFLSFAGQAFCDQDSEFKYLFQKDLWAFEQVSEQYVDPSIFAPSPTPITKEHKKRAVPTPTQAPVVLTPTSHKFSRDTAWCSIKVIVTDKHGNFNFNVQSDAPVVGWEINTDKKDLVKSGDANQMYLFGVDVNQNFTNNLVLTLFIAKDEQTNPVFINLF